MRRIASLFVLTLLISSMFVFNINIQLVRGAGTIYIRADGSIDPPSAYISTSDNVIYTFTDNINGSIIVERDNITLDGRNYTLQGSGPLHPDGITLSGRNNVTIKHITIQGFITGVDLYSSNCNIIERNFIMNNNMSLFIDYGIHLYYSSGNILRDNNITNNEIGINSGFSSYSNIISGNNITNNKNGIVLSSSSNNTIVGNSLEANWWGFNLGASDNTIFHNNFIDNNYDIFCSGPSPASFHNTWDDGYPSGGNYYWSYGVSDFYSGAYQNETGTDGIGDVPHIINENNSDRYPLMKPFTGSIRNLDTGNSYSKIQDAINDANQSERILALSGIYYENVVVNKTISLMGESKYTTIIDGWASGSHTITVTANNVLIKEISLQNSFVYPGAGVSLSYSINSVVEDTIIRNNFFGIWVYHSNFSQILLNDVADNNWTGIYVERAFDTSVKNNTAYRNGHYGIVLWECTNTSVWHNDVLNNPIQAYVVRSSTFWDSGYPGGGNYWGDYNGIDLYNGVYQNITGSDGIGDTAYIIDNNNFDEYPFMVSTWYFSWDVTGDGYVGIDDIVAVAEHFGQDSSHLDWHPKYDINGDEYVGIDDIVEVAEHFGISADTSEWNPLYDVDKDGYAGIDDIVEAAEHFGESA